MAKYQISHKVSNIMTDSALNMLKAVLFNLPCFDSDDEQDYDDQDNLSDEEADLAAFDHLPDNMTCFAHTLQLVVKDGIKVADQLTQIRHKTSTILYKILLMLQTFSRESIVSRQLTTYDRNILSEACDILASFEEVTYFNVFSFKGNCRVPTTAADSDISVCFGQQCITEDTNALIVTYCTRSKARDESSNTRNIDELLLI